MDAFLPGVQNVAEEIGLAMPMPPASLISVDILYEPDVLVEVEAEAILRGGPRDAARPPHVPV